MRFTHVGVGPVDHVIQCVLERTDGSRCGNVDDPGLEIALVDLLAQFNTALQFGFLIGAATAATKE